MDNGISLLNGVERQVDQQNRKSQPGWQQSHSNTSYSQIKLKPREGDQINERSGFCRPPRLEISRVFSSERQLSNLEQFLECTTPRVPSQFLAKRDARGKGWPGSTDPKFFFPLGDLWDSFDEWSAYGAGVPIVLNGGKGTVVQYYVPYLSALQLYACSRSSLFIETRRLGDDSESSDSDIRDSSSDSSSDSEYEKRMSYDSAHCWRGFQGMGIGSVTSFDRSVPWNSQVTGEEFVVEGNGLWQEDSPSHLLFEYFERAAPCIRVPLFDKIAELAHSFPALRSLSSIDLLPSSWLSVAWYPIYRIPTGPTLLDLAACFLTFHSLSTSLSEKQEPLLHASTECPYKGFLQPFGLSSYKFQGSVWNSADSVEHQHVTSLQRSADSWIKSLHVQHPDYEYFMSHSAYLRR